MLKQMFGDMVKSRCNQTTTEFLRATIFVKEFTRVAINCHKIQQNSADPLRQELFRNTPPTEKQLEMEFVNEMVTLVKDLGKHFSRDHSGKATCFLMIEKAVFHPDQLTFVWDATSLPDLFLPGSKDEFVVGYQTLASEHEQLVSDVEQIQGRSELDRRRLESRLLECEKKAKVLKDKLKGMESKHVMIS